ncbi:hemerythrin domain-containing protein [Sediminimonas sp.]|uniref:hemerythrin domain-containing protein n=1 Tax=Sediminimonas sp. TaxID=2823379 RepID=UPI0025D0AFBF|nr:hemerythrin domain-containing protein [Sediminimonas sp.]
MSDELDLDIRTGLPAHLRVLAEKYPRAQWRGHRNFNDLTAFWLERHLMFRKLLDKLVGDAQQQLDEAQPRYGAELSRYTGFFLEQLHGHHMIEDHAYFPKFQVFDKRLLRAFEVLDADHHALDRHMQELADSTNSVLQALGTGKGAHDSIGRLLSVQERFHGFMERHLSDEEEIIVPVVLEYGAEMDADEGGV